MYFILLLLIVIALNNTIYCYIFLNQYEFVDLFYHYEK